VTRRLRPLRLAASVGLAAGLLAVAPGAQARRAANLSLDVTFFVNGTITVSLPDGTPVGSTSGSPTVIPAGFYTVLLLGPGGCTALPHWDLKGPGEQIHDNMTEGEVTSFTYNAYFQPNATYTWSNDGIPGVVYTFKTSSDVQGTPPPAPAGAAGYSAGKHGTATSQDLVGSGSAPLRGKLTGAVSTGGGLSLTFKGKSVTHLTAGRYTITVTDRSKTSGFMFQKLRHKPMSVTGVTFVGKRSATVRLTAGKWFFTPRVGKQTYPLVVNAASKN
jgi:hypothetical protein